MPGIARNPARRIDRARIVANFDVSKPQNSAVLGVRLDDGREFFQCKKCPPEFPIVYQTMANAWAHAYKEQPHAPSGPARPVLDDITWLQANPDAIPAPGELELHLPPAPPAAAPAAPKAEQRRARASDVGREAILDSSGRELLGHAHDFLDMLLESREELRAKVKKLEEENERLRQMASQVRILAESALGGTE